MSLPALQAFVSSAAADDALYSSDALDVVVDLASSHGHDFSKATLLKAHAEAISKAPDHKLEAINSWGDALMHALGASDQD